MRRTDPMRRYIRDMPERAGNAPSVISDVAQGVGPEVMEREARRAKERSAQVRSDLQDQTIALFSAYQAAAENLSGDALEDLRGTIERGLKSAIRSAYREQFRLGKRHGWNWEDLDDAEEKFLERLRREEYVFVKRFLDDIERDRLGMPVAQRAQLYGNAGDEAFWQGYLYADQSRGRYLKWVNHEAEHCFPAGTAISTPGGPQAIESLRVGDVVDTLEGPRRITRLYQRETSQALVAVTAGGERTVCTPNHPFLTHKGWVAAGDLCRGDQVMLHEDGFHKVFVEVVLPDAHNSVAKCGEGSIASRVARPLHRLPVGKRREAGVPMPVVSVDLNDQMFDAHINDKSRKDALSDGVFKAERGQGVVKSLLQVCGVFALMPRLASHKGLKHLVNVLGPPLKHLRSALGMVHRVVLAHVFGCLVMNNAARRIVREAHAELVGFVADSDMVSRQRIGHAGGSVCRIMLPQICNVFVSPWAYGAGLVARETSIAQRLGSSRTIVAASRAGDAFAFAICALLRQLAITTGHAAKVAGLPPAWRDISLARLSTVSACDCDHVTSLVSLHRGTPPPPQDTTPQPARQVYNLEVEGAHHYVADGFVVHNCDDCLYLAGNLPAGQVPETNPNDTLEHGGRWGTGVYSAQELARLAIVPQSGELRCTTNCRCELVPTVRPKGRPQGKMQRKPFRSLAPKRVQPEYEEKRAGLRTKRVQRDGTVERGRGGLEKSLLQAIGRDLILHVATRSDR